MTRPYLTADLLDFAVQAFTAVTVQGRRAACSRKTKDGEGFWKSGEEQWRKGEKELRAGEEQLEEKGERLREEEKAVEEQWKSGEEEMKAEEERLKEEEREWRAGEGERMCRERVLLQQVAKIFQLQQGDVNIFVVVDLLLGCCFFLLFFTYSPSRPSVISDCQLPENEEIHATFKQELLH